MRVSLLPGPFIFGLWVCFDQMDKFRLTEVENQSSGVRMKTAIARVMGALL
jgi:hypothetical protein